MRRLLRVLIGLMVVGGIGVVGMASASAVSYPGPVYRFNGATQSMNVQSFVNTTGTGQIQAVTKFWCFQPGTTNGYKRCAAVLPPSAGVRLYGKTPSGVDFLVGQRCCISGCSTGGSLPACPATGPYTIATVFYPMGTPQVPVGYKYFGQTGIAPNETVTIQVDAGSGFQNAGVPSSGLQGPIYG